MFREIITQTLKETTKTNGYGFYSGFAHRIDNERIIFPAAWITPMQIIKVEGRYEGYLTYRVSMYLMQIEKKITEDKKEALWDQMESDALRIINQMIPQSTIFNIDNINIEPAEFNLSKNGEISVRATCDLKIYFCQSND